MATLPVPAGWKPSNKAEVLAWLGNLEIQIASAMTQEDSQANAKLYVALQIAARVETIVQEA